MVTSNSHEHYFQFTSHPPERGRPEIIEPACAGASCSCCCCCLHTMGGLIGALVFSLQETANLKPLNQEELDFQEHIADGEGLSRSLEDPVPRDGMTVSGIYWRTLFSLTLTGLFIGTMFAIDTNQRHPNEIMALTIFITVMAFPGIQLLAGLITFLILTSQSRGDKPTNEFRHLSRINLGMLAGSIFGLAIMFLLYLIL